MAWSAPPQLRSAPIATAPFMTYAIIFSVLCCVGHVMHDSWSNELDFLWEYTAWIPFLRFGHAMFDRGMDCSQMPVGWKESNDPQAPIRPWRELYPETVYSVGYEDGRAFLLSVVAPQLLQKRCDASLFHFQYPNGTVKPCTEVSGRALASIDTTPPREDPARHIILGLSLLFPIAFWVKAYFADKDEAAAASQQQQPHKPDAVAMKKAKSSKRKETSEIQSSKREKENDSVSTGNEDTQCLTPGTETPPLPAPAAMLWYGVVVSIGVHYLVPMAFSFDSIYGANGWRSVYTAWNPVVGAWADDIGWRGRLILLIIAGTAFLVAVVCPYNRLALWTMVACIFVLGSYNSIFVDTLAMLATMAAPYCLVFSPRRALELFDFFTLYSTYLAGLQKWYRGWPVIQSFGESFQCPFLIKSWVFPLLQPVITRNSTIDLVLSSMVLVAETGVPVLMAVLRPTRPVHNMQLWVWLFTHFMYLGMFVFIGATLQVPLLFVGLYVTPVLARLLSCRDMFRRASAKNTKLKSE